MTPGPAGPVRWRTNNQGEIAVMPETPVVLVTRKIPANVEARVSRDYQARLNPEDRLYREITAPMELVSLGGWIAPKTGGGAEIHAHYSASTVENDKVVTLGGHLTEGTICGIKVVVAILVLEESDVYADMDGTTNSFDICWNPDSI